MSSLKKISRKTSVLIVTAVLSSGVTYFVCHSQYAEEIDSLNKEISTLKESERNAIVIQRVSEQMEDIAYQSKSVADSALQKANFERDKADKQARRAERERHNALLAKDQANKAELSAREQAEKAEHERQIAQSAQHAAESAKSVADSLFYLSLGRSLAQASLTQYNTGDKELANLLSYSGYYYTMVHSGNPYQQDIFTSLLYNANAANNRIALFTGSIHALQCVNVKGNADILAATDYGEVSILSPDVSGEYVKIPLYSDKRYLFRAMCVKDSMAYILDVDGNLFLFDLIHGTQVGSPITVSSPERPQERWSHLLLKKNGNLIAVGQHQLSWVDPESRDVITRRYVDEDITEAGIGNGKLLVFTHQGRYIIYRNGELDHWDLELPKQGIVTSYYYIKSLKLHVIGTDNGSLYLYDDINASLRYTFTGHTAPITHIESTSRFIVTSSYDNTVRLWDMNDIGKSGNIVPSEIRCTSWPLTFAIDDDINTIRMGFADGGIGSSLFDVNENAAIIHKHLQREFTDDEWHNYFPDNVPRRAFK